MAASTDQLPKVLILGGKQFDCRIIMLRLHYDLNIYVVWLSVVYTHVFCKVDCYLQ